MIRVTKTKSVKTAIFDFYNIYCQVISFKKNKTFSTETFKRTFGLIDNVSYFSRKYIVSKEIYEISDKVILNLTERHPNCFFIVIMDRYKINKGHNKERDDFYLMYLQKQFTPSNAIIVSNDKLRNYKSIIATIKPIHVRTFHRGKVKECEIQSVKNDYFTGYKPERINFQYLKSQ
jgi:hypothetical protein